MGLAAAPDTARAETPAAPLLGMISPPADYENVLGKGMVRGAEVDLVSRLMFMQQTHKTYAGTSTVCTGVASRLAGTLVHQAARPVPAGNIECRIGHPGGVITTEVVVALAGNAYTVERATLGRTARRIMDGAVYVPDATFQT